MVKTETNNHAEIYRKGDFWKIIRYVKAILNGYAQIYFSQKWYVGLVFLAATMIIPMQGIFSLLGLILSNFFARLFGMPDKYIKEGFFAYNGLLTSLALTLTYTINIQFAVLLVVSMMLGVFIATGIRTIFERYLFIPVMSLPFVLTTILIISAGKKFQGLIYSTTPFEIDYLNNILPESVGFIVQSIGAAFFQMNVPSGLLIAFGILLFSRYGFLLAVLSVILGSSFYKFLGGSTIDLQGYWIGFNFALTAIAVGGMFVVPGLTSFLFSCGAVLLTAIISAGISMIFIPLGLPVLALPFLITTMLLLFAMKSRISQKYLRTVNVFEDTPEKNLKYSKNSRSRFVSGEIPAFELPIRGEWTITQGFSGEYTHKEQFSHAWDMEVYDEQNKPYKNNGDNTADYYAYKMPVFAPADGKIIRVINHIDENPIGQVDVKNNWGNTVIIWHYGYIYTAYSHLAKGSISVSEGEIIRRNQQFANVGNSGRSPYPHLHFQVQFSPELGAPTMPSEILHYISQEDSGFYYHTHGVPNKNQRIKSMEAEWSLFDAASFPIGGTWKFDVSDGRKQWIETWEADIDFAGNRYLFCHENNAKISYFVSNKVLLLLDYKGKSGTGLENFFLAVPRVPFTSAKVKWTENMPAEIMLGSIKRFIFNLLEPFSSLAALNAVLEFTENGSRSFTIETKIKLEGLLSKKNSDPVIAVTVFERYSGLNSLTLMKETKKMFELKARNNHAKDNR